MRKSVAILVSVLLVLCLVLPAAAFSTVSVKNITLDKSSVSLKVGQTATIGVKFTPANTTVKTLSYSTGNKNVASVDAKGVIKGVKKGSTVVTVYAGTNKNVMAKVNVTVLSTAVQTVKWYAFGSTQLDQSMVMESLNQDLVKKGNVKLDLQLINRGIYEDKMRLIIAAGEDYDICFTSSWMNKFTENLAREAFLPLDSLLKNYGQGIVSTLPNWLLNFARVNGKQMAIPNYQIEYTQFSVIVQKALADKYNFDTTKVKEMKDFEPFLQKLVEKEPNYFPLKFNQGVFTDPIYEPIGGMYSFCNVAYEDKSLTVRLDFNNPERKQQELFQRDWYKRGFIRKDIFTLRDDTAYMKANKFACILNVTKPGNAALLKASTGVDWYDIPVTKPIMRLDAATGTMEAINVNSKRPEAAMTLLNIVMTDKEIYNKMMWGLAGVHYNKTGPERIELVPNSRYMLGSSSGWEFGNQFNVWKIPGQSDTVWEETMKNNEAAIKSGLMGFTFNPTPVNAEIAQLAAVGKEYDFMYYVVEDYEAMKTAQTAKLKDAGVEKVRAEMQKQINAWAKANGIKK